MAQIIEIRSLLKCRLSEQILCCYAVKSSDGFTRKLEGTELITSNFSPTLKPRIGEHISPNHQPRTREQSKQE